MKENAIRFVPSVKELSFTQVEILEKMKRLNPNRPDDMQTLNMGGKMLGGNSISTSCRAKDCNCRKRIDKSIDDIKKFSPEAKAIIERYLLPSDNKKHITGTKAAKELLKLGCKVCVCIFCYADSKQAWQHGAREKFIVNYEYFGKVRRESSEMPTVVPFTVAGQGYFRIEAEGDTQCVNQAYSYLSMIEKPENKYVKFTAWTKNIGYWLKALELKGYLIPGNIKPANLKLVLSSPYINCPDYSVYNYYNRMYPGLIDHLFTVLTPEYAEANGITFNCCDGTRGEKHCLECMNCYRDNGPAMIWEILR